MTPLRRFFPLLVTLVLSAAAARASAPTPRPNIIVLLCDDLGYGDLSCFAHPTLRTPHLDQLAREGVKFTDFYSASPVCSLSQRIAGRAASDSGTSSTTGWHSASICAPMLKRFSASRTTYPCATSDVVALLVLEHQCRVHNQLVSAAMNYRRIHWLQKSLDPNADPDAGAAGNLAILSLLAELRLLLAPQ